MIRWITECLGTTAWDHGHVSAEVHLLDVRDLVDKGGNVPIAVRSKIDEGVRSLRRGDKVVVCCDYGMSRSNAIAAGILAVYSGISLDQAVGQVLAATGQSSVKLEVIATVRQAVGSAQQQRRSSDNSQRRVLMTGVSGFVGSSLRDYLKPRHDIIAPTRKEVDLTRDMVKLDLLARERSIDSILHLANPRVYTTNESMGTAVTMLKNILDICSENRFHLIYLSGWEIYSGYKAQELRADESLPPCPGGTYGQTKFLCENLIDHYHRQYGIRYTLLRSSPAYGPGGDRPKFIWNFLDKARQGSDIVAHRYRNGLPALDLLYVDDLCRAIIGAIEREPQGAFNLGTGVATSTTDLAQQLIERVGSRSKVRHLDIDSYASNVVMDYGRASAQLGWVPTTTLAQGLDAIVATAVGRQPHRPLGASPVTDGGWHD